MQKYLFQFVFLIATITQAPTEVKAFGWDHFNVADSAYKFFSSIKKVCNFTFESANENLFNKVGYSLKTIGLVKTLSGLRNKSADKLGLALGVVGLLATIRADFLSHLATRFPKMPLLQSKNFTQFAILPAAAFLIAVSFQQ